MEDDTDPKRLVNYTGNSNDATSDSFPVVLPVGYKLSQWRVPDGSVVHTGETIAVISPIDSTTVHRDGSDNVNADSIGVILDERSNEPQQLLPMNHKRPSRRKRPLAVTSESTDAIDASVLPVPSDEANQTATKTIASAESQQFSSLVLTPSSSLDSVINSIDHKTTSNTNVAVMLRDDSTAIVAQADGIFRKLHNENITPNKDVIIGWIDLCRHPTIISGLCAVCGAKVHDGAPIFDNGSSLTNASIPVGTINSNTNKNMTLMTVSGMTVTVSESESKRMAIEDTKRLQGIKKLSLVLDLDHTLLHATADPRAEMHCRHRNDVRRLVLPYMTADGTNPAMNPQLQYHPGWFQQHFVKLRPHVKEFLEQAMEHYEIGVYTAGTRDYAEQVTILLSRHLVGAEYDQIELQQLRQKLAHVEQTYQRQQKTWKKKDNFNMNKDLIPDNDGLEIFSGSFAMVETHEKDDGGKRKRVQFEPASTTTKTDEIFLDELENLKAELLEAERLERRANDLRRSLFGSRVMSRTESGESSRNVKSLKRIFPCGGSMAAVIDDREDVWANTDEMNSSRLGEPPENLMLVRPYHWISFHGYADINNASGIDYSAKDNSSQAESDEQLLWTTETLKSLHQRYYNDEGTKGRTVPMILEEMRSGVLKGCVIVLSGLIPLSKQSTTNPKNPRPCFIRYAESLGALVQAHISESVTHVVAASDGTDKIISARKIKGCKIVSSSWLVECFWSMTRRDESTHFLGNSPRPTPIDANMAPKLKYDGVNDSITPTDDDVEDDDDDDDFAAELENEFLNEDDDEDTESNF